MSANFEQAILFSWMKADDSSAPAPDFDAIPMGVLCEVIDIQPGGDAAFSQVMDIVIALNTPQAGETFHIHPTAESQELLWEYQRLIFCEEKRNDNNTHTAECTHLGPTGAVRSVFEKKKKEFGFVITPVDINNYWDMVWVALTPIAAQLGYRSQRYQDRCTAAVLETGRFVTEEAIDFVEGLTKASLLAKKELGL